MLTPREMLERGVFGGNYFAKATWADMQYLGEAGWLVRENQKPFNKANNYYGAKAGESYEEWERKGWLFPEDPLGWFHWYCRFTAGRRHSRDAHQIRRHNNYRERWGKFARGQVICNGDASAVVKQGLLQWGLDPFILLHGDPRYAT